jgi:basic membrane protein A
MDRRTIRAALFASGLALLAAGCGSTGSSTSTAAAPAASSSAAPATTASSGSSSGSPFKVAFILVGPKDDGGWSQAHYAGAQALKSALGDKVDVIVKENVPEGPQSQQVVEDLVRNQGAKAVFATSFGYGDALNALAAKYPDVKFEWATGTKPLPNLAVYYGAGEDGIYLSGMAAGAATKNGKVGYVVPFPIPEVIRHADAFALGVQKTHPGATVKLIWTKSWFDPAKETKAAESLVSWGADVVGQNVDSPATGKVAEAKKVGWVGYDSDASAAAPNAYLGAATYDWGPYYVSRVKAAMDGSWKTGSYYGSLADGFVKMAPWGKGVSGSTQSAIQAEMARLKAKPQAEFTGPIKDQSGAVKVPAGQQASLDELLSIDWLVQGVDGSPKG